MAQSRDHKKILTAILIFILILFGLNYVFQWFVTMIFGGGCVETPIYTTSSPDGNYIVTEFEANCGPTVQTIVHINLRDRSKPFTFDESVLEQGLVLSRLDPEHFKIQWIDNKKLEIIGPSDKILKKKNRYRKITIKFKTEKHENKIK